MTYVASCMTYVASCMTYMASCMTNMAAWLTWLAAWLMWLAAWLAWLAAWLMWLAAWLTWLATWLTWLAALLKWYLHGHCMFYYMIFVDSIRIPACSSYFLKCFAAWLTWLAAEPLACPSWSASVDPESSLAPVSAGSRVSRLRFCVFQFQKSDSHGPFVPPR